MLADHMSKPQQGQLFKAMRQALMNLPDSTQASSIEDAPQNFNPFHTHNTA